VARLTRVKEVTLIALTDVLTLENAHRFGKSRDVGCYVGLQPGRRNSGQSEPQRHISKEGDRLPTKVTGPGGAPYSGTVRSRQRSETVGIKAGGARGKNGKKQAVVAVARKLTVLLHRPGANRAFAAIAISRDSPMSERW
jgi:transposase